MSEAVALQQIQKIAMYGAISAYVSMDGSDLQILLAKTPWKINENHDFQRPWKNIWKSRYDDTLRSHLRSKLQSLWTTWRRR